MSIEAVAMLDQSFDRRRAFTFLGGAAALAALPGAAFAQQAAQSPDAVASGAGALAELTRRLAGAPRRRGFDRVWPEVLVVAAIIIGAKVLLNATASLLFRWSVPGSTQLGFLLAQGSEFAFVILSLPPMRVLVGEARSSVLIAAVALTLAVAPSLAEAGRYVAGRLRRVRGARGQAELIPRELVEPVLIVGMGERGRTIADGLNAFGIGYAAIEENPQLLREAVADGYKVIFGNLADPRIWEPVSMGGRQISVLTTPSLDLSTGLTPIARRFFPDLTRIAIVDGPDQAEEFAFVGLSPVIDNAAPLGLQAARAVLDRLGISPSDVDAWAERQSGQSRQSAALLAIV